MSEDLQSFLECLHLGRISFAKNIEPELKITRPVLQFRTGGR